MLMEIPTRTAGDAASFTAGPSGPVLRRLQAQAMRGACSGRRTVWIRRWSGVPSGL